MFALALKEFRGFFSTLLGYVVVSIYLVLIGLVVWVFPGQWNILDAGQASLESFFIWGPWVMILIIPAITMRTFSEEIRSGTMELLLTKPISTGGIVGAKYLGALAVFVMSILPTLIFIPVIGWLGEPEWNFDAGAIRGSYIGLLLIGASFTAVGVAVSAWTRNPLVSFLIGLVVLVFGFIGFTALASFDWLGTWDYGFSQLGMEPHYRALSRGVLASGDVYYFALVIGFFLWLARFGLDSFQHGSQHFLLRWILGVAIQGVLFSLVSMVGFNWDLTEEQRFTLTDATVDLVEGLEDEVFVTCYLTGEYPAEWKRLERAIRSQLEDLSSMSDGNIRFQFIDVYEIDDQQTIGQNEEKLIEQGLQYSRIAFVENGAQAFKVIWPAALVTYQNKTEPVQFFRSEVPEPTDRMIQGSINSIEYELTRAIRKLKQLEKPRIAIIEGHGELDEAEFADFTMDLETDYEVYRVEIGGQVGMLSERIEGMSRRVNRYDLVIIAKPDSAIDAKDQVIIDQFIMNGGKALWLVDPIRVDLDSLAANQMTMGVTNELGIYDQLFQYGVRFNRNLVIDLQCAPIVMGAGPMGNQENWQIFDWYFAPVVLPFGIQHPITTNLDPIKFDFASRLDTVQTDGDLKKTVLLASSELSKEYKSPIRVSSNIVQLEPEYFTEYSLPNQPLAVLIEGEFRSAFEHRLPDTLKNDTDFAFQTKSVPTAQIMIGDGDIARNQVRYGPNGPMILPLGYERMPQDPQNGRVLYDNKEFLRNAVSYLLDETAAISVRSRTITLRPLNEMKVKNERVMWQSFAMIFPILIIGCMGLIFVYRRKHRFSKKFTV